MNERIHILNYWPDISKWDGLVRFERSGDLVIFNYTEETQWSRAWDNVTRQTRGLIINDKTGKLVAYPFDKFFNINETPETQLDALPKMQFECTEKIDGALGILYVDPRTNGYKIATRGSFVSEEALWASSWIESWAEKTICTPKYQVSEHHRSAQFFDTGRYTYMFEICSDQTQFTHVAMKKPGLYLIGMRDLYTYKELMPSKVIEFAKELGLPYPVSFSTSVDELLEKAKFIKATDGEGWVLHYVNGLKVKIKGLDYIRLARFLQSFSARAVFELVRDGHAEVPNGLPEKYESRFKELVRGVNYEFVRSLKLVESTYQDLKNMELPDRKAFAITLNSLNTPDHIRFLVFQKRDNKFTREKLWETLTRTEAWKNLES